MNEWVSVEGRVKSLFFRSGGHHNAAGIFKSTFSNYYGGDGG
jgi:hypothetical protein